MQDSRSHSEDANILNIFASLHAPGQRLAEVPAMFAFLAPPQAAYICKQVISVNGGTA